MSGSRLGNFFSNRQEPGRTGLPVMSVTMNDSLVFRDDLDRRLESALRPDQHLLVKAGDIAYNMMRMWQGACGLATEDGMVSPAYVVLSPKPGIDPRFAYHWFKSDRMIHLFWAYSHGLTEDRLRLYFDAFAEIPAAPPGLDEQRRIVATLDTWDTAINQSQRLLLLQRKRLSLARKLILSDLPTETTELGEFATVASGIPAPQESSSFASSGTRFVRVSDLAALAGEKEDEPEYLSPTFLPRPRVFTRGTIVFAKSGKSAELPRVVRLPDSAHLVSHIGAVNARDLAFQSFLHHWLVEHPPSTLIQGDAFPSIRLSEVAKLPVPAISLERAAEIGLCLDSLERDIARQAAVLSRLKSQKRSVLQKYLPEQPDLVLAPHLPPSSNEGSLA